MWTKHVIWTRLMGGVKDYTVHRLLSVWLVGEGDYTC